MATFCPYCNEDIEKDLHEWWAYDYPTYFDFKCPKCGEEFEIDVEATPHFTCHKK